MKFVFFGTPEFAAIILEKLINAGYVPEAVVCNPDRPVGRKKIIIPPAVKELLIEKFKDIKIKILQPEKLDNYLITQLLNYQPELFIVAAYAKILSKEILEIPRLGTIGVHPSLLPKYRGATPIQTAILNGDEITGTTIFLIDEKMDHGAIIANSEFKIQNSEWNYELLMRKLAELSADLLIEFLRKIDSINNQLLHLMRDRASSVIELQSAINNLAVPQDELLATYTKKFKTEDGYIPAEDLKKAQNGSASSPLIAIEIERKIRALNPEPGIFTIINNKRVKLLEAEISDNKLKLTKIQLAGKNPQTTNNLLTIIN